MIYNASTISIPSGHYVDISVPVAVKEMQGAFPKKVGEAVIINGEERLHISGFVSENESVGTVAALNDGILKVRYTHLQNRENRIYFCTANNDYFIISIISIPIHTHGSIEQGGPAYGTYMADVPPPEPATP